MNTVWQIEWMKCIPKIDGELDYVVECGWRCTGTQEHYTGTVYSSCSFAPPTDALGDFIPYAQLTEPQVLGWVWDSGVDKAATEAAVQAQIDAQINPPVVQLPLPWQTAAAQSAHPRS